MDHFAKKKFERIERYVIENATILDKNFEITVHCPSNDIKSISFRFCKMYQYPSAETLLNRVSDLTYLAFYHCGLTSINCEDLKGLESLTTLNLAQNDIECLPKGLFDYTPKLETITFSNNKIKWIDQDILESLNNLKFVNLRENVTINVKFDTFYGGDVTLPELKELIRKKCKSPEEVAHIREKEALVKKLLNEDNQMKELEQEFDFNEIVCDTGSPKKKAGGNEIKADAQDLEKGSKHIAMLKDKLTPTFKIKTSHVCYAALCLGCLFVIARIASK